MENCTWVAGMTMRGSESQQEKEDSAAMFKSCHELHASTRIREPMTTDPPPLATDQPWSRYSTDSVGLRPRGLADRQALPVD
jgi:hypothetical protein